MQSNKLSIQISKPVSEVFTFTITPPNSTKWVPGTVEEFTSELPVKVGTVYRLKNEHGQWSEYTVTAFERDRLFELVGSRGNYHVRYIYRSIDKDLTEFTYFEWVEKGELDEPFTKDILEKLKAVLETARHSSSSLSV